MLNGSSKSRTRANAPTIAPANAPSPKPPAAPPAAAAAAGGGGGGGLTIDGGGWRSLLAGGAVQVAGDGRGGGGFTTSLGKDKNDPPTGDPLPDGPLPKLFEPLEFTGI